MASRKVLVIVLYLFASPPRQHTSARVLYLVTPNHLPTSKDIAAMRKFSLLDVRCISSKRVWSPDARRCRSISPSVAAAFASLNCTSLEFFDSDSVFLTCAVVASVETCRMFCWLRSQCHSQGSTIWAYQSTNQLYRQTTRRSNSFPWSLNSWSLNFWALGFFLNTPETGGKLTLELWGWELEPISTIDYGQKIPWLRMVLLQRTP